LSASEYKYIISKCRFGVFARTHAAIAAYSTCVPCTALGYSTKAVGIASDLGLSDYVVSIGDLTSKNVLLQRFTQLIENENEVKSQLERCIGSYIKRERSGVTLIA
jgi:polysaccharide pyruvyl transferase WcaK-like protein